jgi:hypothetical protein
MVLERIEFRYACVVQLDCGFETEAAAETLFRIGVLDSRAGWV